MKLFAQKEAEAFVKTGAKEFRYNRDIRLTPGAKDIFADDYEYFTLESVVLTAKAANTFGVAG
jgi:predicted ATPase